MVKINKWDDGSITLEQEKQVIPTHQTVYIVVDDVEDMILAVYLDEDLAKRDIELRDRENPHPAASTGESYFTYYDHEVRTSVWKTIAEIERREQRRQLRIK